MKKKIALTILLLFLCSVVGCGNKSTKTDTKSETKTETKVSEKKTEREKIELSDYITLNIVGLYENLAYMNCYEPISFDVEKMKKDYGEKLTWNEKYEGIERIKEMYPGEDGPFQYATQMYKVEYICGPRFDDCYEIASHPDYEVDPFLKNGDEVNLVATRVKTENPLTYDIVYEKNPVVSGLLKPEVTFDPFELLTVNFIYIDQDTSGNIKQVTVDFNTAPDYRMWRDVRSTTYYYRTVDGSYDPTDNSVLIRLDPAIPSIYDENCFYDKQIPCSLVKRICLDGYPVYYGNTVYLGQSEHRHNDDLDTNPYRMK